MQFRVDNIVSLSLPSALHTVNWVSMAMTFLAQRCPFTFGKACTCNISL